MSGLSDVVYRIQKSSRAKPKVVHADRLRPYLGPPLRNWLPDEKEKETARNDIPSSQTDEDTGMVSPMTNVCRDESDAGVPLPDSVTDETDPSSNLPAVPPRKKNVKTTRPLRLDINVTIHVSA